MSSAKLTVPKPEGEKAPASRNMVRVVRTESTDTDNTDEYVSRYQQPQSGKRPPMSPAGSQMAYSTPYSHYQQTPALRPTRRQLQSVVTTSFSTEERDEPGMVRRGYPVDQRVFRGERRLENATERRDGSGGEQDVQSQTSSQQTPSPAPPARVPPSPSNQVHRGRPLPLHRAHTTGDYYPSSAPMKRNFYHHARQCDSYNTKLPPDFVPPKRAKANPPQRREVIVSPTSPPRGQASSPRWYPRASSWEAEEQYQRQLSRAQSFPSSPSWNSQPHRRHASPREYRADGHPMDHTDYVQITPSRDAEMPSSQWHPHPGSQWSVPSPRTASSPRILGRDARSTSREDGMDYEVEQRRRMAFEPPPPYPPNVFRQHPGQYMKCQGAGDKMQMVADAAAAAEGGHNSRYGMPAPRRVQESLSSGNGLNMEGLTLLALPEDKISLSETLCVVRENIEVFTATQSDVEAPAPGRKHAVTVGQVGLRCIHCRHTTRCSDRVKRAVCYPSSIKRIYRTVIDMKLDHFSQCKYVPTALKERLDELKAIHTRSTGTTMQYFIRAAHALGMEDGPTGVRLTGPSKSNSTITPSGKTFTDLTVPPTSSPKAGTARLHSSEECMSRESSGSSMDTSVSRRTDSMVSQDSFDTAGTPENVSMPEKTYKGSISLALPEDKTALSPLRCFLREQVCAFSATEEDIAVRAPTTFSISVGQVGIGCIHCVKQQAMLRSNRAVCFPFSIGRIYQSVADIQRFHFSECKSLPAHVKAKFLSLQSASSKGSKGLATRQYWVTSAKKIGLVDTPKGIRFGRDPAKPEESKAFSLDILAQVAFSVTTANRQLVLPEDKPHIAEFLYVVMEQLQPCRFTEADRNKRRLKDVGCIGVECKHCAGQVDSRKFFWSSVNAVESNFVSVHTHMLECRMVPEGLKQRLIELKKLRKEQTAALKTGSQKAFFARVWDRLHEEEESRHLSSGDTRDPQDSARSEESPRSESDDADERMEDSPNNVASV